MKDNKFGAFGDSKASFQQLELHHGMNKSIINALDQSAQISQTDLDGKIFYANQNFIKNSGLSLDEIIGKKHSIIKSGVHSDYFFKRMWETILQGIVWKGEICNRSKNGELLWYSTTILPIRNVQGVIVSFLCFSFDITKQKTYEEQIKEMEKFSFLGEFVSQLLHDIMNPISYLKMLVQINLSKVQNGQFLSSEIYPLLQKAETTIDKVININQSMREFLLSRPKDNTPQETVAIQEFVIEALDLIKLKISSSGAQIINNISLNKVQLKNARPMEQVLVNLLSNACDAIKPLPERWIQIDFKKISKFLQLIVTDSGNGIPLDIQNNMFRSLFSTKKSAGGTGLGLGLCKKIMSAVGGNVYYVPEHKNTTFIMEIPLDHVILE